MILSCGPTAKRLLASGRQSRYSLLTCEYIGCDAYWAGRIAGQAAPGRKRVRYRTTIHNCQKMQGKSWDLPGLLTNLSSLTDSMYDLADLTQGRDVPAGMLTDTDRR